jgi:chemotaxis protein histidine kinase CheA
MDDFVGNVPQTDQEKQQDKARDAAKEQAQQDHETKSDKRSQECADMADLAKHEAQQGNYDEAIDALEDCCQTGNPKNPLDNGSMESAKEEVRDAINDSDLTDDQKQAASEQIDNMQKGQTASDSQQSSTQAKNDAQEANSQSSQNNPDAAQEAMDNAVDNLNDAIDTAESREDWASIKDAAEAGVQAAEVMQDQETADAMNEVAKTADQELNEQKWGILDKDTGQFIEDQGTPMTFDSEAEAQAVIDSMDADGPHGDFEVAPLGNPIDEAMNRADMGDLDQSREDIQEAFEEAYTEEMQRLENMEVICTIVNLDGTYAKSEWPELYESVATWLELGGDPNVLMQMMSGQEPEHKRTDRVKVTDYLGLYKDPVVIDYPDPNDLDNWKPVGVGDTTSRGEVVRPWLDAGFDIGTIVTVSQDFGSDYVVVIPPSDPNTFVGGLLLPKLTLDCYQPVPEGQGPAVPWDPSEVVDSDLTPKERAKQEAKEKAKKRSLSQTLSTDRRLETRVDLISGEIKQFTGNQLAAGEAGFTFIKTRLLKMGPNIYPVALPGVIDYCNDKGIKYTILESSPQGYPIKLEVAASLKPLLTQMGKPLKLSSGKTNDVVVISYR